MTAIEIIKTIQNKGFEAYFVGGFVRDMLMKCPSDDIDIVTSATPDEIEDIFKNNDPKLVGKNFGVVIVDDIEIATFRKDRYLGLSDKNVEISYAKTLEEDVSRRDFTINAIAFDPIKNKIFDFHNGQEDLKNGIIRFINDPGLRINEDPNRIVRACRFLAKIDGRFEDNTFHALKTYSKYLESHVAVERLRLEVLKAMKIKKASIFFRALHDIEGLSILFPSLDKTFLHPGGPYHIEDVFDHCMMAGDHCTTKYPLVKLAAYLHDIGKPISCRINPRTDDIWFEGHEETGEIAAKEELENLRFSNDEVNLISGLIRFHMRIGRSRMQPKGIRRTLKVLSDRNIDYIDLLRVSVCDMMGNLKSSQYYKITDVYQLIKDFRTEINRKPANKFSDLKIDGFKIMEITEVKPGKVIGLILNKLMDLVIDEPELNTEEILTEKTIEIFKEISCSKS